MDNKMETIVLFDGYEIRGLSEQEYDEITHYEKNQQAVYDLCKRALESADSTELPSLKKKIEVLCSRKKIVARSFGVYYHGEYAGYISFAEYNCATPEIQIELEEGHRNKGVGYRAVSLLTSKIFEERQDIEYFLYRVRTENVASIKLIEKLGGTKIEKKDFVEQIIKGYHLYRK